MRVLWLQVRRTPPRQLAWRLWLTLKRRALAAWFRVFPRPGLPAAAPLSGLPPLCPSLHVMPSLSPGTPLGRLRAHAAPLDAERWIAEHPPYGPRYWEDAWNSWALSIRVVAWMDGAPSDTVLRSLTQQVRFLLANLELDIRGNHLLKNIRALACAGHFFADPLGARCRLRARQLLDSTLEEQFPDGLHFENSPAYHVEATADLLDIQAVLPGERLAAVIGLARRAAAEFTHPDGGISLLNDGGSSWQRPVGSEPRPVFCYPRAGYVGVRGEDFLVLYDFGQLAPDALPAHSHGDIFSFELSAGGQRVIVDPGTYQYHPGRWRRYARGTPSHNTLSVDRADQGELLGSFRLGRRPTTRVLERRVGPSGFEVTAEHDGFAPSIHRRTFAARPGSVTVQDAVRGGSGRCQASLLLHPSITPVLRAGAWQLGPVRLETSARVLRRRSWWCPDLEVRLPTQRLVLDYGSAPCQGGFALSWEVAPCTSGS